MKEYECLENVQTRDFKMIRFLFYSHFQVNWHSGLFYFWFQLIPLVLHIQKHFFLHLCE